MTNPSNPTRPRNQSVDAFRLLAALGVIILHVGYPNIPGEIAIGLRLMSRWAIPFFFIVSGYFLAVQNAKAGKLNIQPAIERLILVFLIWSFVYAIVVAGQYGLAASLKRILSPFFIYFGNFTHLWFLPSLILGYWMVAFCYNLNLKWLLGIFAILAVILALLSGSYAGSGIGLPADYVTGGVWLSIPFLSIGFLLHQKGQPAWWASVILILIGAGMQVFEARFLYDRFGIPPYDHEFLIGTIPFGIGMAGLALSNLKFLGHPLISSWGRDYSLGIYLIHPITAIILNGLIRPFLPDLLEDPLWQISFPLVVLLVSIFLLGSLRRFFPTGFNVLLGKPSTSPR
ncbi:MAG: acyltransferase [Chloroflexi bacterium]|nr:acyltransferase [Chloroflexota bacterium]